MPALLDAATFTEPEPDVKVQSVPESEAVGVSEHEEFDLDVPGQAGVAEDDVMGLLDDDATVVQPPTAAECEEHADLLLGA